MRFAELSLPRNEGRPQKERMMETCRLTLLLYARLVLPVMILLQAFTIS